MPKKLDGALLHPIDRRKLLGGMGLIPAGLMLESLPGMIGRAYAKPLDELVLYGPPAGPSIILAQAVASGALSGVAKKTSFKVWRSPDEMRAGLTSGTMSAVVLPIQVAANLYNRGMPLKLLNIMTKGLVYVISEDAGITTIEALKGKKLAVPFRNDMPDLILKRLLATYKLSPETDVVLEYTSSPVEAIQMLMMGRVDAVLAPEPAISAAITMGKMTNRNIRRVIDIQEVWGQVTGKEPVLPQAGMVLTDALMKDTPQLAAGLQDALAKVAAQVIAEPAAAASIASTTLDFPEQVLALSIATSKLVATPASEVRSAIEIMLETLAADDPAIIGGKLPDAAFYL